MEMESKMLAMSSLMILVNLEITIKTVLVITRILMMITTAILIQLKLQRGVIHLIQLVFQRMQIKTAYLMQRR